MANSTESDTQNTEPRSDNKIDDLNAFLRDTLLEFKGEIGELRGTAHTHPPAQD